MFAGLKDLFAKWRDEFAKEMAAMEKQRADARGINRLAKMTPAPSIYDLLPKKPADNFTDYSSVSFKGDGNSDSSYDVHRWLREYKSGQITHDAYLKNLEDEAEYLKSLKLSLAQDRRQGLMDEYEYQDEVEQIRDQMSDVKSALKKADELKDWDSSEAKDDRWNSNDFGKWCRFSYYDSKGNVTARNVVNWQSRGRYIIGYCKAKKEERTFRKSRITDWISG